MFFAFKIRLEYKSSIANEFSTENPDFDWSKYCSMLNIQILIKFQEIENFIILLLHFIYPVSTLLLLGITLFF